MFRKKIFLLVLHTVLFHSFYSYTFAANVIAQKIQKGSIEETIPVSGEIRPFEEYIVTADVTGNVRAVLVDNGMKVESGEIIILLEQDRYRIAVEQARAALDIAAQRVKESEKDFARNKVLAEQKVINDKSFDRVQTETVSARNNYRQAKAALALAELNLSKTAIQAPISGFFVNRNVYPGQTVSPGTPLGKVIKLDRVYVEAKIPENYIRELSIGQECLFEGERRGKIAFIDLYADNARAFLVKILLDNSDMYFKARMFIKGEIVKARYSDVPLIPSSALVSEKGSLSVFIAEKEGEFHRAKRIPVKVMARKGEIAYVSGVEEGQTLITVGQEVISDGETVSVTLISESDEKKAGQKTFENSPTTSASRDEINKSRN